MQLSSRVKRTSKQSEVSLIIDEVYEVKNNKGKYVFGSIVFEPNYKFNVEFGVDNNYNLLMYHQKIAEESRETVGANRKVMCIMFDLHTSIISMFPLKEMLENIDPSLYKIINTIYI